MYKTIIAILFLGFLSCSNPVEPNKSEPEVHRACDTCHDYPIKTEEMK